MHNAITPPATELPSTLRLLKSTIIAALAALVLLLTIVMPAEYGIDPTGLGSVTGLKRMGEIKMSLAQEAAADEQAAALAVSAPLTVPVVEQSTGQAPEPAAVVVPAASIVATAAAPEVSDTIRSDEMQVTLTPDQGTEIKVTLAKGKTVEYSWRSSGGPANFDVHGDSAALAINYHSYSKGAEQSSSGIIEAAFDGNHGWFWRNRTTETITVTLQTRGEYTDIKHLE